MGWCGDGSIPAVFSWKRPDNLGVSNGALAPCKPSPNCVSSQARPSDAEHHIAPIRGTMAAVRSAVQSMPRATIISEKENYLYAEFRTKLLRYVDDVEFFFDGAVVHVSRGAAVDGPIHLLFLSASDGRPTVSHPPTCIRWTWIGPLPSWRK